MTRGARLAPTRLSLATLLVAGVIAASVAAPAVALGVKPSGVDTRPNIVVVYLDDVAPIDGRLWSNPSLTPTLYDLFVARGTTFSNAIGETPLCCPGRSGLLTGLHTHNHGVDRNDGLLLDPSETIGTEMTSVGYTTMLIGKYLNEARDLTADDWLQHGAGWTNLDVIDASNGRYVNYDLHTKEGIVHYDTLHSTQMVGDRTVMRMQEAPADAPIFSIMSLYNMHGPNRPLPEFENSPLCADMPKWNPPNYNEADVSDKPAWIQSLPLLPDPDGWSMVTYCEEALGIDKVVGQVRDELEAEGRLSNTLWVLSADNGMAWGAHRLGQKKGVPWATPVPLMMSWPDGWGTDPRTIPEVVSNIDLAPTFCALAGCTMGPYADGQLYPDGVDLTPLLDGSETSLSRLAVLEEHATAIHPWNGLRTTLAYGHLWHYVEWDNGERELYDLENDPWELTNLANDSDQAVLITDLSTRLRRLEIAPEPDGSVDQTTLNFGDRLVGTSNGQLDVTFTNESGSAINVDDVIVTGINRSEFSADGSACTGHVIVPTGECTIQVTFAPTAAGRHAAMLDIQTGNDSGVPTRARLLGKGVAPGSIRIVEDSLPDNTVDFSFSGSLGSFVLDDLNGSKPAKSRMTTGLAAGSYQIIQAPDSTWALTSITCTHPETVDLASGTLTVNLTPGEKQVCTFTNARRRPDAMIALNPKGPFTGDHVYKDHVVPGQTVKKLDAAPGSTTNYTVRIRNGSLATDSFTVQGVKSGPAPIGVRYKVNKVDVTSQVVAGTYTFPNVAPNGYRVMTVSVTAAPGALPGDSLSVTLTSTSVSRPTKVDVVQAVTTIGSGP